MKSFLFLLIFTLSSFVFANAKFPKNIEHEIEVALLEKFKIQYLRIIDFNISYIDMDPGSEYYFTANWKGIKPDNTIEQCTALIASNGKDIRNTTSVLNKECTN